MVEPAAKRACLGFSSFFRNLRCADVVVKIGPDTVDAHKIILVANSKFFEQELEDKGKAEVHLKEEDMDVRPLAFILVLRMLYSPDENLVNLSTICEGNEHEDLPRAFADIWRAACFFQVTDRIMWNICRYLDQYNNNRGYKKIKPMFLSAILAMPDPEQNRLNFFVRYLLSSSFATDCYSRRVQLPAETKMAAMQIRYFLKVIKRGRDPIPAIWKVTDHYSEGNHRDLADKCWPIATLQSGDACAARMRHGGRVPVIWAPPHLLTPRDQMDLEYSLPIPNFCVKVKISWALDGDTMVYKVAGVANFADLPVWCILHVARTRVTLRANEDINVTWLNKLDEPEEFTIQPVLTFDLLPV